MNIFQILKESASFNQLLNTTKKEWGDGRLKRSKFVDKPTKPEVVLFDTGDLKITFTAKSFGKHSTTGRTFSPRCSMFPNPNKSESVKSFVALQNKLNRLGKSGQIPKDVITRSDLKNMTCKVHCDCPDFIYRMEYANAQIGAADIVNSNGQWPEKTNPSEKPGICKHLMGLISFLGGGGNLSGKAIDSGQNK